MGRPRRVNCKVCGRHIDECGPLSVRGLCEDDSIKGVTAAIEQVAMQHGPLYDKWVLGTLRHAQRVAAQYDTGDAD